MITYGVSYTNKTRLVDSVRRHVKKQEHCGVEFLEVV